MGVWVGTSSPASRERKTKREEERMDRRAKGVREGKGGVQAAM